MVLCQLPCRCSRCKSDAGMPCTCRSMRDVFVYCQRSKRIRFPSIVARDLVAELVVGKGLSASVTHLLRSFSATWESVAPAADTSAPREHSVLATPPHSRPKFLSSRLPEGTHAGTTVDLNLGASALRAASPTFFHGANYSVLAATFSFLIRGATRWFHSRSCHCRRRRRGKPRRWPAFPRGTRTPVVSTVPHLYHTWPSSSSTPTVEEAVAGDVR